MAKKICLFILFAVFAIQEVMACDKSTISLISQTQSGCTSTFTIQVCAEYNGLEGPPDILRFTFNCGVTVNAGFSPASYQSSTADIYTGVRSSNTLTYTTPSVFIAHCCQTLCTTFTITTTGHPTSVDIMTNDYPSSLCVKTLALNGTGAPTAVSPSICANNSVTLTATSCSGTPSWYDAPTGGTLLTTGASYPTPVLNATTTYYVQCLCSGGTCASARTPVTVTVSPSGAAISGASSVCSGVSASLTATGGGTYLWNATGGNATTATISVSTPGTYVVTVTNAGCTATLSQSVTAAAVFTVTATNNGAICAGQSIQLHAAASISGVTYAWTGTGYSATGASPDRDNATTGMAGTYQVTATETSTGCTATGSTTVTVSACSEICGNGIDDDDDGLADQADTTDCPCRVN